MGSGARLVCLHVSALSLSLSFPWGARGLAQIGSQALTPAPTPDQAPQHWLLGPLPPLPWPPPFTTYSSRKSATLFKLLRAPCCHCSVPAPRAWLQGRGSLPRMWQSCPPGPRLATLDNRVPGEERVPPASQPAHLAANAWEPRLAYQALCRAAQAAALLCLLGPGEVGASVMADDLLCGGQEVTPALLWGQPCAPCPQHPHTPVRSTCSASACSEPWNSRKSVGARSSSACCACCRHPS